MSLRGGTNTPRERLDRRIQGRGPSRRWAEGGGYLSINKEEPSRRAVMEMARSLPLLGHYQHREAESL